LPPKFPLPTAAEWLEGSFEPKMGKNYAFQLRDYTNIKSHQNGRMIALASSIKAVYRTKHLRVIAKWPWQASDSTTFLLLG
jgi:hypothetical protein